MIGNGNSLINLPGSSDGTFYYCTVKDINGCIIANWIDDPIAVYEPEAT